VGDRASVLLNDGGADDGIGFAVRDEYGLLKLR
jgi:hypothetical protein